MLGGDRCGAPRERSIMPDTRPVVAIPLTDELLAETRKRVADAFSPEPVILFGSHAEGRPTSDSDLDLLAVTARPVDGDEHRTRTQGLFRDLLPAVQVITISRLEYEETRDVIGGVAYPAAKCGRVFHEDT